MADWNPSLYLKFGAERTRPAAELVARIAQHPVTFAVDLGCGHGNNTALLHHAAGSDPCRRRQLTGDAR